MKNENSEKIAKSFIDNDPALELEINGPIRRSFNVFLFLF